MIEIQSMRDNGRNPAKIKLAGVGGCGNNAVKNILRAEIPDVETIMINTDAKSLRGCGEDITLQIGEKLTKGLGAGGNPEIGEQSAYESEKQIIDALSGADMVIVSAGMGGGTGTGAAPVVSKLARDMGILTVGIVTKPFFFEGAKRMTAADMGIEKMKASVDALIVILNSNLMAVSNKNTSFTEAFRMVDDILKLAILSITETINQPGLINLDFADVKTIMKNAGLAHMGVGRASGDKKAEDAAFQAMNSSLVESSIDGATGIVINITGGNDLGIMDVRNAVEYVREHVDPNANLIFGARIDENLEDQMHMTLIATGFVRQKKLISGTAAPVVKQDSESKINRQHDSIRLWNEVAYPDKPAVGQTETKEDFLSRNKKVDYDVPSFIRQGKDRGR